MNQEVDAVRAADKQEYIYRFFQVSDFTDNNSMTIQYR